MPETLNISRFFSDRMVIRDGKCSIDRSNRFFSWLFSPRVYAEENRRTVRCFKKYLLDTLGSERLSRICTRYGIHFQELEKSGGAFLSRHAAMISIGVQDVSADDINELIEKAKQDPSQWPAWIDRQWREPLSRANTLTDLEPSVFNSVRRALASPFDWRVEKIAGRITGRCVERIGRLYHDPFQADRERLQLVEKHPHHDFAVFMHNMAVNVVKREMDVGALIPAPPHPSGSPQFYYVAAKVVTGEGMVSYILLPAHQNTNLEPVRLYRGSAFRSGEVDALSTLITDLEENLGESSYVSGDAYQPILDRLFNIPIVAGHSLGSTQAQFAVSRDRLNRIRQAYLFNGPGVSRDEVEAFNRKMQNGRSKVRLTIRDSTKDKLSKLGQYHLGYQAPANKVTIDYVKYHAPSTPVPGASPHVMIYPHERTVLYGIAGTFGQQVDEELDHTHQSTIEPLRASLGPALAWVLKKVQTAKRFLFSSRAHESRGLYLALVHKGAWCRLHVPPSETASFFEALSHHN